MQSTTYEINVAYKGLHDFTITLDRNGPDDVNSQTAHFTLRTMQKALGDDYELRLTEITTAESRVTLPTF